MDFLLSIYIPLFVNNSDDNYSHNTYTAEQWEVMEAAGGVILLPDEQILFRPDPWREDERQKSKVESQKSNPWVTGNEIKRQMELNRTIPEVSGACF